MNTTHEYTNEQIQAAIDAAFPAGARPEGFNLDNRPSSIDWKLEAPNRLAIARAFLASLPKPSHCVEPDQKADPYARLKSYAAAGARIRCGIEWAPIDVGWSTRSAWQWSEPVDQYEVHPDDLHLCPEYAPQAAHWTLPAPPAGFRWHREDWKPEWLEGGYRPLLDGEVIEAGDEYCPCGFGPWKPAALDGWAYCVGVRVNSRAVRFRTRRPLPAEASAEPEQADASPPWIPHDGGLCPLKDEEVEEWEAKYSTGETVRFSHIKPRSGCCWTLKKGYAHYTHYRVLRWKPGHGPQAVSKEAPATFEVHGKTLTRHTPGDPCPCDPEANIELLLAGGSRYEGQARFQSWGQIRNNPDNAIIGWRYADEPAQAEAANTDTEWNEYQQELMSPLPKPWTPRPGDVVRLKSGGPEMTVAGPSPKDGLWETVWISNDGSFYGVSFPAACLTPTKEGQP